jgi:hypothetical protein
MRRAALVLLAAAGCPSAGRPRPYAAPEAQAVVAHVRGVRDRVSTLNADTKADIRLGDDRVNVTVLMLAAWGGKLRFQAHDPNESTAADLASDGKRYCAVDMHHNCGGCGPATPENVARLVRIPLAPDDVVTVLVGSAPLIDGAASVEWDAGNAQEILTLRAGDQVERIALDGVDQRWDVLEAELKNGGNQVWDVKHKDFHDVTTAAGATVRLPGTSLFTQGGDTVRIGWRDQKVGAALDDAKFHVDVPAGLPACP